MPLTRAFWLSDILPGRPRRLGWNLLALTLLFVVMKNSGPQSNAAAGDVNKKNKKNTIKIGREDA